MVFTSLGFLLFLVLIFVLYWSLAKSRKAQNVLLLLASYIFYCTAALPRTKVPAYLLSLDFSGAYHHLSALIADSLPGILKLLFLLWFSSSFGYFMARFIQKTESPSGRKSLMTLSAIVHLGILCYFKYMNFFAQTFVDAAGYTGWNIDFRPEHIMLPLAISFFTFHILGYTFDIYQRSYAAATNYIDFITHIAFFPQLVAGPIERASHLLPQFTNKRTFDIMKMEDGLRQMLWGFFKKLVIADSAAKFVNYVFHNSADQSGSNIALAGVMFTIQMYCDFSGYSDIALGTARLLGFELLKNFSFPFFSTSMTDFWRKWHISLTSWITDYLYTPISFAKRAWGPWGIVYAAVLSFTISGLWHGANWPSILWGLMHGLALGYEVLTKKRRKKWSKKINPILYSIVSGLLVFSFWSFGQLIFRATSLHHIGELLSNLGSASFFTMPDYPLVKIHIDVFIEHISSSLYLKDIIFFVYIDLIIPFFREPLYVAPLLFLIEWFQRHKEYGFYIPKANYTIRWTLMLFIIFIIFSSDNLNNQNEFIYFQF